MTEPTLAEQIAAVRLAKDWIDGDSSIELDGISIPALRAALATLEASQTREAAILRLVEAARAIQETWTAEDIDIGRRCRVPDDLKQIELFDALDALDALPAIAKSSGWRDISTAPKDFTPILAHALGADGRPMIAIVHWGCAKHMFSSKHQCSHHPSADCEFEWIGVTGARYGVPFTDWMPQPPPTAQPEGDER